MRAGPRSGHGSGGDGLSRCDVPERRDGSVGAAVSNGVVAFPCVAGAIGGDAVDLRLRRDLVQQVGSHRGIEGVASGDLQGPTLPRFLLDPEMGLAPDTPLWTTMLAGVPRAFARDASAVNGQVQRPLSIPGRRAATDFRRTLSSGFTSLPTRPCLASARSGPRRGHPRSGRRNCTIQARPSRTTSSRSGMLTTGKRHGNSRPRMRARPCGTRVNPRSRSRSCPDAPFEERPAARRAVRAADRRPRPPDGWRRPR